MTDLAHQRRCSNTRYAIQPQGYFRRERPERKLEGQRSSGHKYIERLIWLLSLLLRGGPNQPLASLHSPCVPAAQKLPLPCRRILDPFYSKLEATSNSL